MYVLGEPAFPAAMTSECLHAVVLVVVVVVVVVGGVCLKCRNQVCAFPACSASRYPGTVSAQPRGVLSPARRNHTGGTQREVPSEPVGF